MEWRDIIYEDIHTRYEVSDSGLVRNKETGKFLRQYNDSKGYKRVYIVLKTGYGKNVKVHRLVATAFISNKNNLPMVNHIDGIKSNNNVFNLEWCTAKHNSQHAIKIGLFNGPKPRLGTSSNFCTVNNEQTVHEICQLLQNGEYSYKEIFDITGIKKRTVQAIKRGEIWQHISCKYDIKTSRTKHSNGSVRHDEYFNTIDRAIIRGENNSVIVSRLIDNGFTERDARSLLSNRKRSIKNGTSMVQNTIYIDEGIEIF